MAVRYYVRVSTFDQKIDRQLIAYDKADSIYIDKMTGVSRERPKLKLYFPTCAREILSL